MERRHRVVTSSHTVFVHYHLVAVVALAALLSASPASAQLDSEPLNNSALTADLLLPPVPTPTAVWNRAELGASGSDVDFFSSFALTGQVLLGMVTPLSGLPTSFSVPDTMLATFTSTGAPLTFNDDSFAAHNVSSGAGGSLFRLQAPGSDLYRIGVTGFDDENFNGFDDFGGDVTPHGNTGEYGIMAGRVDPAVLGGDFADTDPLNNTRPGADPIALPTGTAAVSVATLLAGVGGDVDFYSVQLNAGDVISALVAPLSDLMGSFNAPDTLLTLYNAAGTQLLNVPGFDDDSGGFDEADDNPAMFGLGSDNPQSGLNFPFGSAFNALIPADGIYYIGVTGFGDPTFDGGSSEAGRYALLVSRIPEPTTLGLLSIGLLAFMPRQRRV